MALVVMADALLTELDRIVGPGARTRFIEEAVVERLLRLPRTRETKGYLAVPGHPSEGDATRMVVGLPRR